MAVIHALFFIVAAWDALTISGEFAAGPYAAAPLFLPLAVVVIGAVRLEAGTVGGRPILAAGDLGVIVLLAAHLSSTPEPFLEAKPIWLVAAVALGAAGLISLVPLRLTTDGIVVREPRDRRLLVVLVVADVVAIVGATVLNASTEGLDLAAYFLEAAAPTIGFDIAVFAAWWWGSRWVIAAGGVAGVAIVLPVVFGTNVDPVRLATAVVPQAIAIGAGIIGPHLRLPGSPSSLGSSSGRAATRAGDVWIAVGALLWPLLVLYGLFPIVSDLCFSCGPRFPGDDALASLAALTILGVPVAAVAAIAPGRRGPGDGRPWLQVLLASSVLLLADIGLGLLGVLRFAFLGFATPPAVLVGIGATARLVGRTALARSGAVAPLGAAALVVAWTWQLRGGFTPSSFVQGGFVAVSLIEAAVVAIGLGLESSRARAARGWPALAPADR